MLNASTIIAAWLSLVSSAFTIWFTMFRRGAVRMTRPAFILFGANFGEGKPRIAVGAHLYTTAQRGAIVEGMFARVTRGRVTQDFDLWTYGKGNLSRRSAVHVGREGVTDDHHFLVPEGAEGFQWLPGEYTVDFFGTIVGRRGLHRFCRLDITLTDTIHETAGDCVLFDWRPALNKYEGHVYGRDDRVRRQGNGLEELVRNSIGCGDGEGAERDE